MLKFIKQVGLGLVILGMLMGCSSIIRRVAKANYFSLKVDYFDHLHRHIKTAIFEDIKPMGDKLFSSFKVAWKRLRQKTSTIMAYKKIDLGIKHKDIIFANNYMKRPVR